MQFNELTSTKLGRNVTRFFFCALGTAALIDDMSMSIDPSSGCCVLMAANFSAARNMLLPLRPKLIGSEVS